MKVKFLHFPDETHFTLSIGDHAWIEFTHKLIKKRYPRLMERNMTQVVGLMNGGFMSSIAL